MDIHDTKTPSMDAPGLDQCQHFFMLGDVAGGKLPQKEQRSLTQSNVSTGELADDQRVDEHLATGRSCGLDPPSRARRRALSRWMRARKPSCKVAVRSSEPVSVMARASNSSSRFTVVRMSAASLMCQS